MTFYEILDNGFENIIQPDRQRKQLATGMAFTEGPVWVERDQSVLFTDIPANRIMRWNDNDGLTVFNANAHFAIGLYLDPQGRLIVCEHSTRRLTRYEQNGRVTVLASHVDGEYVLNSTNDVVVRASDGAIFFTDPPFGVRQEDGQLHGYQQAMEYGYCGVFKVTDDPTRPHPIIGDIYRPNGLCFSPDEKTLYVSDSSDKYHHIHALTLNADDVVVENRIFAVLPQGVPDGMRVDSEGNLYVAGLDGVYVYAPDAALLGKLLVPEMVTNICFGGVDRKTLFVTAVSSLYAFELEAVGIQKP
jgi:gluconolactonase